MRWQKLKSKLKIEDLNIIPDEEPSFILNNEDSDSSLTDKPDLESGDAITTINVKIPGKPLKNELTSNLFIKKEMDESSFDFSEFTHVERNPIIRECQPTYFPSFLLHTCPKVRGIPTEEYCYDRRHAFMRTDHDRCGSNEVLNIILYGAGELDVDCKKRNRLIYPPSIGGLYSLTPKLGWNYIVIPDKHSLIMDAGKLYVLDTLLSRLKAANHRVLIYSQMTKMIDLLEEYMWHRKHKYMRLDGSSKISDRRDMVEDFQNKSDIFVFLLSTRAGGVGINLTAADTVIFYDSDWNPTVDQQAMDRAHRLGQTKQVTVYRLICRATIEERMLQRAQEKREIQQMVISGGGVKPDTLKPKEVVSLLLDDDIEKQYKARQLDRRQMEDQKHEMNKERMRERMRKRYAEKKLNREVLEKRRRVEDDCGPIDVCGDGDDPTSFSQPNSPISESSQSGTNTLLVQDDASSDALQIADVDVTGDVPVTTLHPLDSISDSALGLWDQNLNVSTPTRRRRRGRPRGSTSRGRGSKSVDSSQGGQTVVNGNVASAEASVPVLNGESSSSVALSSSKRSRGRPRLAPTGPGNQGTRGQQGSRLPTQASLPAALGSYLVSSQETNHQHNDSNS